MSDIWRPRGAIARCAVPHLLLSPRYTTDRTIFAVTPAGLAIGRTGEETWETPARGRLGPFIRDLAAAVTPDGALRLLATTPAGLFHSPDGGRAWSCSTLPLSPGPMLLLDRDDFLVAAETAGDIWRGELDPLTLRPVAPLPAPAIALARLGETIWAATADAVYASADGAATWTCRWRETGQEVETLVARDPATVVIGTTGDGMRLLRASGEWWTPALARGQRIAAIAVAAGGRLLAAGGEGGIVVSRDGGESWARCGLARPVLALTTDTAGAELWAGLADDGAARSRDWGATWQMVTVPSGAVVVELRTEGERLLARTVEGERVASRDGGATWGPGEDAPLADARFAHVARNAPGTLAVAATATEVFAATNGGCDWTSLDLALPAREEIVGLAIAETGEGGDLIAVASRDASASGSVWLRAPHAAWRRVIAHPAPAPVVLLPAPPGVPGLFAAIGDSVYRPARGSALLFAREVVDPQRPGDVLALAAHAAGDEPMLAALTAAGLYLSRDGGLSWRATPPAPGAPVTALTLRPTAGGAEVVAIHLGGQVSALAL